MIRRSDRLSFLPAACLLAPLILLNLACESGSATAEGAKRGATTGAVSGAVGGLVSALVFGGDPIDRAARGAVYGGATGATAGAIAGSQVDRQRKAAQESELKVLREKIGDDAFEGLAALAECRHEDVLRHASKAVASENPNFSLAGMWLEVIVFADQRDEASARALYPDLVAKDWNIKTEADAEAAMRQGLSDLMDIRERYKLPRVCSK